MERLVGALRAARTTVASAVLVTILVAVPGLPAAAQTSSSTTSTTAGSTSGSTTTSTSTSSTSSTSSSTSSSTTTIGDTTTSTPGETPSTTVPPETDGEIGDQTTTTDPLLNEEPGETVPDTDETVPEEPDSYGGQPDFVPDEVLWSSVEAAKRKVDEAIAARAEAIERVREARLRRKAIEFRRDFLTANSKNAIQQLQIAEAELQAKAVAAFVADETAASALVSSIGKTDHDAVLDLRARHVLLNVALEQDEIAIATYNQLRARTERSVVAIVDSLRRAERRVAEAASLAEEAELVVAQAQDELYAFEAGSAIYISGVTFPIARPYNTPLIDSWGFPRMPGTPDEHWHEGIDLFAPAGTPLLATERGVITRINTGRLGGLTLWLRGESGADWYYAHLQAYAPDLQVGAVVEAGQVLGFVGNTGNAISTPSHLHLQLHPGGGDPINPYPLLKVVSDRDLAAG